MYGNALNERLTEISLNAFRIVFGLMFMQHGAQKLFPAPFDRGLRGLIQKRIALSCLVGSHVSPCPHAYRQSRSLIRPRCISSFGATSATRM